MKRLNKYAVQRTGVLLKRFRKFALLGFSLLCLLLPPPAYAREDEKEVIAVFLFNFLNFVQWPNTSADTPMQICVYGEEDIVDILRYVKERKNRPVNIVTIMKNDNVAACHILYISHRKAADMGEILRATQRTPQLTVSDESNFTSKGGIIEFVKGKKLKLLVNRQAYQDKGLKMDPRLLQLAEVVNP